MCMCLCVCVYVFAYAYYVCVCVSSFKRDCHVNLTWQASRELANSLNGWRLHGCSGPCESCLSGLVRTLECHHCHEKVTGKATGLSRFYPSSIRLESINQAPSSFILRYFFQKQSRKRMAGHAQSTHAPSKSE